MTETTNELPTTTDTGISYKEIAERILARGIGTISIRDGADEYCISATFIRAEKFCTHPAVVLACLSAIEQDTVKDE